MLTGVAGAATVVAVVAAVSYADRSVALAGTATPASVLAADAAAEDDELSYPSPGVDASPFPLGTPIAAPAVDGGYEFLQLQDDGSSPVGFDPCRPIHYVVRPDGEPVGGNKLLKEALGEVSGITGLEFVYDGETSEAPREKRPAYQPDRYGDRWAPVLISWADETEVPGLAGTVVGLGGSRAMGIGDAPYVYVTGAIELDERWFHRVLEVDGDRDAARATVLHELGHVLGLAHVDDPASLMAPTASGLDDFGAGDLAGLVQLGEGACVPDL